MLKISQISCLDVSIYMRNSDLIPIFDSSWSTFISNLCHLSAMQKNISNTFIFRVCPNLIWAHFSFPTVNFHYWVYIFLGDKQWIMCWKCYRKCCLFLYQTIISNIEIEIKNRLRYYISWSPELHDLPSSHSFVSLVFLVSILRRCFNNIYTRELFQVSTTQTTKKLELRGKFLNKGRAIMCWFKNRER